MRENDLMDNIKEFLSEAKRAHSNKAYNSAVTLYFKALAVISDLHILRSEGIIPSNHTQRFRILEEKYQPLYTLLDKDFPIYQNSYKIKLGREYSEVLKKDVEKAVRIAKIEINMPKI